MNLYKRNYFPMWIHNYIMAGASNELFALQTAKLGGLGLPCNIK